MLDKLEAIRERYDNVNHELMQPEVMSDMKRFKSLNKEYKELGKIVLPRYPSSAYLTGSTPCRSSVCRGKSFMPTSKFYRCATSPYFTPGP